MDATKPTAIERRQCCDTPINAYHAESCLWWKGKSATLPAMGQPTNADLEKLLHRIADGITDWRLNWRLYQRNEARRAEALYRNDKVREQIASIDTRLETLEAAFGIASSKGTERFDDITDRVDALARIVIATAVYLGVPPLNKPKKKHHRKR